MESEKQNLTPQSTKTIQPDVLPTGAGTEQTSPIPEPPKKNWALIVGIVVLVLAVLGTGGYFAYQSYFTKKQTQPTPSPTAGQAANADLANWKTYTNSKYGFSFKYPENGTVTENPDNSGLALYLNIKSGDTFLGTLQVSSKSPKNLLSFIENQVATQTSVSGISATKITGDEAIIGGSVSITAVYFVKENYTYILSSDQPNIAFDQILSTFKFLGATNDISNWKTYTDSKNGFSIRYPSTWRSASLGENGVGFGPKEIGEDILWGVNVFDKATNSVNKVVDDLGKQFSDRKQITNKISVNGISASQVITTTATIPNWYYETIIFETSSKIITISNGAIKDEDLSKMPGVPEGTLFKNFYSTFKFTQ